jgi:hypothetical protein
MRRIPLAVRRILRPISLAAVLAVSMVAGSISAPSAMAGDYHVYSCRTPSGGVAPADGWSGSAGPTYDDYAIDTCATGGALTAALGDATIHIADLDQAAWTLSVPAAETVVGATLWRAGDVDGGEAPDATYEFLLSGSNERESFDGCVYQFGCTVEGDLGHPLAAINRVGVPGGNVGSEVHLSASCEGVQGVECPAGHGDINSYAAVVDLFAADVVLEQNQGPAAKEVSGPLATEKPVAGTSDLVFSASDPGAGIWETTFSVDGNVVQRTVPNEAGGRCREVGQSTDGLPGFLYLQPCPQTEDVDVPFDTTVVGNGIHHLVVSVIDPAGNSAPVLDREIDVENGPPAAPASPAVGVKHAPSRLPRARVTLRIEPHRVSLRQSIHFHGRVLGGHIPKVGKLLTLEARLVGGGTSHGRSRSGRWFGFAEIRTGRQGRFHGSYQFSFLGPGDYQIRVLAKAEAGYPFATGWSRALRVKVV